MSRKQVSSFAKKEKVKAEEKIDSYIKDQYKELNKKESLSEEETIALSVMKKYLDKYHISYEWKRNICVQFKNLSRI